MYTIHIGRVVELSVFFSLLFSLERSNPFIFAPGPSTLLLGCNKYAPVSLEDIKDAVHEMNGENRILSSQYWLHVTGARLNL